MKPTEMTTSAPEGPLGGDDGPAEPTAPALAEQDVQSDDIGAGVEASPPPSAAQKASAPLPSVNLDVDLDDNPNDEHVCIICLDDDVDHGGAKSNGAGGKYELIAPCVCRSYVHRRCLDVWRVSSMVPQAMTHCPTCKTAYEYEEDESPNKEKNEAEFRREVHKQILSRILLVLAIVFVGSMSIWGIDRDTPQWMNFNFNGYDGKIYDAFGTDWPHGVVYFICGLLSTLFMFGIVAIVYSMIRCCRTSSRHQAARTGMRRRRAYYYNTVGASYATTTTTHHNRRTRKHNRAVQRHRDDECFDDCCDGCVIVHTTHDDVCCTDCFSARGDSCSNNSSDNGGALGVILLIIVAIVIIAGLIFLMMFIVGSIGKSIDRKYELVQNEHQAKHKRVKNLRPISNV